MEYRHAASEDYYLYKKFLVQKRVTYRWLNLKIPFTLNLLNRKTRFQGLFRINGATT